jgi:hypothetical protein
MAVEAQPNHVALIEALIRSTYDAISV